MYNVSRWQIYEIFMVFVIFIYLFIYFLQGLAFFIFNIVGNIFLSSSISGNKPWGNLSFMLKPFKEYCRVPYFPNLRNLHQKVKFLKKTQQIKVMLHRPLFLIFLVSAVILARKRSCKMSFELQMPKTSSSSFWKALTNFQSEKLKFQPFNSPYIFFTGVKIFDYFTF